MINNKNFLLLSGNNGAQAVSTIELDGYSSADGYIYSVPVRIENVLFIGLGVAYSGGVGTFSVQVSPNPSRNKNSVLIASDTPNNWIWIDAKDSNGNSSWTTAANPSPLGINIQNTGFAWFRLKYQRTSGTQVLTAIAQIKGP